MLCLQASSVRAPALLECVAAMAASPHLAPVLAGQQSLRPASEGSSLPVVGETQGAAEVPGKWQLGHK